MIHSIDEKILGDYITLERLHPQQVGELFPVLAHKLVFASGFGGGLSAYTTDPVQFEAWAQEFFPFRDGATFIVRIAGGPDAGTPVGTVSIRPITGGNALACEMGWSGFDPRVWDTAVNAETKLHVLSNLFIEGCESVRVHSDDFNLRHLRNPKIHNVTEEILRLTTNNAAPAADYYDIHGRDWLAIRSILLARINRQGNLPIRIDDLA